MNATIQIASVRATCRKMAVIHLLMLMICWSVVEVNSQLTFPYVSFMGQTLANHSYVDLSLVGDDYGSDSVQCHTDLGTCCSGPQGGHRGDWYFPNGTRLPFGGDGDIFEARVAQRVDLHRRNSVTPPVGIYHCGIPTIAVHDDDDISVRATVYVGLYTASGGMCTTLWYPFAHSLQLNTVKLSFSRHSQWFSYTPQMQLLCISLFSINNEI